MKKFNGMESQLIVDALDCYVTQVERDINEIRQTKDAYYVHPLFQGGDFIKPTDKPAKTTGEIMNPSKYTEDDLEQAKCSIAEKNN